MNITVEIKKRSGVECIVPICDNAKRFAKIAKHDSLHRDSLQAIRELGYEIIVKQQEKMV